MSDSSAVHVIVVKDVPSDSQREWLEMANELSRFTWKEAGCLAYTFIRSASESTRFFIVEEWESKSHLEAHFETEHFKRLVPKMDAISSTINIDQCSVALTASDKPSRFHRSGRILIMYDSATKCTQSMADLIAEGVRQVDRMELRIRYVGGEKNFWDAPDRSCPSDHLEVSFEDLVWADGIACGTPTNLGGISWRMKRFWDEFSQSGYWNAVDGKLCCAFSSQGAHGGGGELVCQALNNVMLNFGFSTFGITDYVSFKNTLHYGAVVAKSPREEFDFMPCRRLGRRLAEFVGFYINGRDELHPLKASKKIDSEQWGPSGIPPKSATMEEIVALNKASFKPSDERPKKVLVYTLMEDYVHNSTPAAASFLYSCCKEFGWDVIVSADKQLLEEGADEEFDLIVLVNNSGQLFDPKKAILTKHIAEGKGVLGVHAALASFLDGKDASGKTLMKATTPIIEEIFKAHFLNHPPPQTGKVVVDRKSAAFIEGFAKLPDSFDHYDEFFNFSKNPCEDPAVNVLAYVDESTYEGGLMGAKHPVVWNIRAGDKSAPIFYCALGHFDHFYNGRGADHVATIIRAGLKFCLSE